MRNVDEERRIYICTLTLISISIMKLLMASNRPTDRPTPRRTKTKTSGVHGTLVAPRC